MATFQSGGDGENLPAAGGDDGETILATPARTLSGGSDGQTPPKVSGGKSPATP